MTASRVLFVGPTPDLSFVKHDLDALSARFGADAIWRQDYASRSDLMADLRGHFNQNRYGFMYVWFADPYDVLSLVASSRRHKTPSVLVVGGFEVTYIPELEYGGLGRLRDRVRLTVALQLASEVLPTSELLATEVNSLGRARNVHVVPPGIDCDFFVPGPAARTSLVVTVATITKKTLRLKGLDVFAQSSKRLPEVQFAILGPCEDPDLKEELRSLGGSNLIVDGHALSSTELRAWYQKATVYAQLSIRDSFGIALAEAMACGCCPVVSTGGALPDVVGGVGRVVPCGDPESATSAIEAALSGEASRAARSRIVDSFRISLRHESLEAVAMRMLRVSRKI